MVATVVIFEKNGAGEVNANKGAGGTTIRFKNADNFTVDANNPLVKPAGGSFDRSFKKCLRLHISGTGPTGQINNLRFYTDGSNGFGTGMDCFITSSGTYTQPTEPANETGTTTIFGFTSGTPYDLDTYITGGFNGSQEDIGDYVYVHVLLSSSVSAPQNPSASEVATFAYDET